MTHTPATTVGGRFRDSLNGLAASRRLCVFGWKPTHGRPRLCLSVWKPIHGRPGLCVFVWKPLHGRPRLCLFVWKPIHGRPGVCVCLETNTWAARALSDCWETNTWDGWTHKCGIYAVLPDTEGRCMRRVWESQVTTHTPATGRGGQVRDVPTGIGVPSRREPPGTPT